MKSLKDIENLISAINKFQKEMEQHQIKPIDPQIIFIKKTIKDDRTGIVYHYLVQDKITGVWDKND